MEQILYTQRILVVLVEFPISRDPPEGGTSNQTVLVLSILAGENGM